MKENRERTRAREIIQGRKKKNIEREKERRWRGKRGRNKSN